MSKESLDYEKLCCNYYSSWEDGCCMESCEHYHRDECPIIYVKELLAKKDDKISTLEKALELACDYLVSCEDDELFNLVKDIYDDNEYLRVKIKYFKDQAQKELKNEINND